MDQIYCQLITLLVSAAMRLNGLFTLTACGMPTKATRSRISYSQTNALQIVRNVSGLSKNWMEWLFVICNILLFCFSPFRSARRHDAFDSTLGVVRHWMCGCLPFGLSSAPWILIGRWWPFWGRKGIRLRIDLDDNLLFCNNNETLLSQLS